MFLNALRSLVSLQRSKRHVRTYERGSHILLCTQYVIHNKLQQVALVAVYWLLKTLTKNYEEQTIFL